MRMAPTCIVCRSPMTAIFSLRSFRYHQCRRCRQVVTLPFPSQDQLEEHYRRGFQGTNYRVAREESDVYRSAMGALADVVCRHLPPGEAPRLLDIGCFTGEFLLEMRARGAHVTGVELQREAAAIAEERLPGSIIRSDVLDPACPLPAGGFDVVTLLGVVEHVLDPVRLLNRMGDLLRPGGKLVIQTPDAGSCLAASLGPLWPPYTPVEHIHFFSRRSIGIFLRERGYGEIRVMLHVKTLSISYVYGMLKTFGPGIRGALTPAYALMPPFVRSLRLPFTIGEMIVIATKRPI